MRRWIITLCLLFPGSLAAAELRGLQLTEEGSVTRAELSFDGRVQHNLFTLAGPDRLVLDVDQLGAKTASVVARVRATGVVKAVRSGPRGKSGQRIVFDLRSPVVASSFALPPSEGHGYRLMLDLAGPAGSAAAAKQKQTAPVQMAAMPAPSPAGATAAMDVAAVSAPLAGVRPQPNKPIVIAVDAGHGGDDPGAIGKTGLYEKNVALSISRKLAALINQQPGYKAVLTRDGDYYIGLRERVVKARAAQADMFVSIHANAYKNESQRGSAVYVLSSRGATNEHARWLAQKENSADFVGGVDIHDKDKELAAVLIDLSQASTMEASFDVGTRVLSAMGRVNTLQRKDVQQAGFMVLKAPDIPSILVETAFITNRKDEKLLGSSEYQLTLARAVFDGVKGYFRNYRPQQQIARSETAMADEPAAELPSGPTSKAR
jgi:N-acetylmuramoyl-L-alanine amidase